MSDINLVAAGHNPYTLQNALQWIQFASIQFASTNDLFVKLQIVLFSALWIFFGLYIPHRYPSRSDTDTSGWNVGMAAIVVLI